MAARSTPPPLELNKGRLPARVATAPHSSERITTSPIGRRAFPDHSTGGRRCRASITSTVSSAERWPVAADSLSRHYAGCNGDPEGQRGRLHAERFARRRRHPVYPTGEVSHARPSLLHLLRPRRDAPHHVPWIT